MAAVSKSLRVATLNILAPELLCFFWRSSYGLPLLSDPALYLGAVTRSRLDQCVALLRAARADVVCLQETSDLRHASLGGRATAGFIADELQMRLASCSSKDENGGVAWGLPPGEQVKAGDGPSVTTGVATLFDPLRVAHLGLLAAASGVALSPLARAAAEAAGGPPRVHTPHVADEFALLSSTTAGSGGHDSSVVVVNLHVKMLPFPHIRHALDELLARLGVPAPSPAAEEMAQCADFGRGGCSHGSECRLRHGSLSQSQFERAVFVGDFNAQHAEADADFRAALLTTPSPWGALRDVTPFAAIAAAGPSAAAIAAAAASGEGSRRECRYGEACYVRSCRFVHPRGRLMELRCNDHVLLGPRLQLAAGDGARLQHAPLLEDGVRHALLGAPRASDPRVWGPDGPGAALAYSVSARNRALLESGTLVSDHPCVVADVELIS